MSKDRSAPEHTGSAAVFARTTARLEAHDAARSLWQKLQQEMATGGVPASISYLRTMFIDLSSRVTAALPREDRG